MRVLATIVVAAYALFLLHGWIFGMGRTSRRIGRAQRSAGNSFGQLGSVTGRVRPPRVSSSLVFILIVCGVLLWAFWWHK